MIGKSLIATALVALPHLPQGASENASDHPRCSPVTFEVDVSAQNVVFAAPPDPNNETAIVEWGLSALGLAGDFPATSGLRTVDGTFVVSGTYCQPGTPTSDGDVLQLIVSGATYGQDMWYGYGVSDDKYNYPLFAARHGHHTLTVDRLGLGADPQRPHPIEVIQAPLEVEILHELVASIRSGGGQADGGAGGELRRRSQGLDRAFGHVVYVGHSLGSAVGASLARTHPDDLDAVVLTAASMFGDLQSFRRLTLAPARHVSPHRFPADLPLEYLTTVSEAVRRDAFYHPGGHDPAIPPRDFATQATVTLGELGTFVASFAPATAYKGKVLLLNGDSDPFTCGHGFDECAKNTQLTAEAIFPNATARGSIVAKEAGHDWTLHYSAPEAFAQVQKWLDESL